jgi:hypothetical protein
MIRTEMRSKCQVGSRTTPLGQQPVNRLPADIGQRLVRLKPFHQQPSSSAPGAGPNWRVLFFRSPMVLIIQISLPPVNRQALTVA